jgi:RecF/RecN/SMC N terminal domain
MHLKSVHLKNFKRFTDTHIVGVPESARLIILAGPNGCGKSSLFDGLKIWHWNHGGISQRIDETYISKVGQAHIAWPQHVAVEFHEELPHGVDEQKKLIYVRSAFRNEAEFNISGFNRLASPLDRPPVSRMIDNDVSVSENYQRLIMATVDGVYRSDLPDTMTKGELRERIIGKVQAAMAEVFPKLQLTGVGGVTAPSISSEGTFYFAKGDSDGFLYKNLSAGEKAAFDLLLDIVIKGEYFEDTVWCIDEPEVHLNTRVQAHLLQSLMSHLPTASQMILASHSIGFMRGAWEMAQANPGSIVFLDMDGVDFDAPVTLQPITPNREFWARTLDVALGDLASLMAPEHVVLCEGRPASGDVDDRRAEFDASCYRSIFAAEFPNTDFLSVGNSLNVRDDRLEAGRAIQTIASGTHITRIIDRDLLTEKEADEIIDSGVNVLSRRNIEAYLLDDEVLTALCHSVDKQEQVPDILRIKAGCLARSVQRGNAPDDYKKAAGEIYNEIRVTLQLVGSGSGWNAFARDILAPLLHPEMSVYRELRADIFGS